MKKKKIGDIAYLFLFRTVFINSENIHFAVK